MVFFCFIPESSDPSTVLAPFLTNFHNCTTPAFPSPSITLFPFPFSHPPLPPLNPARDLGRAASSLTGVMGSPAANTFWHNASSGNVSSLCIIWHVFTRSQWQRQDIKASISFLGHKGHKVIRSSGMKQQRTRKWKQGGSAEQKV